MTTIIDGKEEKRQTGAYWTVPAGKQMSLQVTSESASLEAFSIKGRRASRCWNNPGGERETSEKADRKVMFDATSGRKTDGAAFDDHG